MRKKSRTEKLEAKVDKLAEKETKKEEKNRAKNLMRIKSVQSFCPVKDVVNGIIVTVDNRFVKLMEFSPINFTLRSAEEQDAIAASFARVLKIMPVKVQFKIISKKADVTGFIESIKGNMANEGNENCRILQQEQIDLINQVAWTQGVNRRFFFFFEYEKQYRNPKTTFGDISDWANTTAEPIASRMNQC